MTKTELARKQLGEDVRHNKEQEKQKRKELVVNTITGVADTIARVLVGKAGILGLAANQAGHVVQKTGDKFANKPRVTYSNSKGGKR